MLFFPLGKEDAQLLSYNGFTLVEVLISSSIIFLFITIIFPLITLLYQEQKVLSDRRMITDQLHDELQQYIWLDSNLPQTYFKTIHSTKIHFHFTTEEEFIKGCVTWENVRQTEETFCLYGLSKK